MKQLFTLILLFATTSLFGQECNTYLDRVPDKFEDQISFYTRRRDPTKGDNLKFMKVIKSNKELNYLIMIVNDSKPLAGVKGAFVLFEDGSKLRWEDAEISVSVDKERSFGIEPFSFKAFIELTMKAF